MCCTSLFLGSTDALGDAEKSEFLTLNSENICVLN